MGDFDGAVSVPLTRDDITALRKADDWSFHTSRHGVYVRAYVRQYGSAPYVWTRSQQVLFPEAHTDNARMRTIGAGAVVSGYRDGYAEFPWGWSSATDAIGDAPGCYASPYNADVRRTITQALRPGEALHLSWRADNNSESIRSVGFHSDELYLYVSPEKGATRVYFLERQVGPNNTARMVRRGGSY